VVREDRIYTVKYDCGAEIHFDLSMISKMIVLTPAENSPLFGTDARLHLAVGDRDRTEIDSKENFDKMLAAWRNYKNQLNSVLEPLEVLSN